MMEPLWWKYSHWTINSIEDSIFEIKSCCVHLESSYWKHARISTSYGWIAEKDNRFAEKNHAL